MPDPKYLRAVAAASLKYGVPARLLAAQIQGESNWDPTAESGAGAKGISQFMPGTAAGYHIDPNDPMASIDAQGKMMGKLLKSYKGDQSLALAAYNAGAGAVADAGGKVPDFAETKKYIKNVMAFKKNYPGLAAGKWGDVAGDTDTPGLKLPDGTTAVNQPTFSVPGELPRMTAQPLSGGIGTGGSPVGGITVAGLMDSAKQRLGLPTPEGSKSHLLDYLMQSAQATTPAPLKLPDGTVAQTQPNRPATGAPGVDTAAIGSVFDPHTKFKMGGGPAAHQSRAVGNWQSDNAVDLMVPVGTPIYAPADGVVGSRIGLLNSKDPKMAGLRASLSIAGNELYYAHMSRLNVKAGQKVKAGQIIGWSGSANGADHLHLGVKNGDPSAYK